VTVTPRKRYPAALGAVALALLTSGCAVGPDYVRPELATETPEAFVAAVVPVDSTAIGHHWWEAMGDAQLNDLVDQALQHNLNLVQATAAVMEARATLGGAQSDRWPTVSAGASASRSQSNMVMPGASTTMLRSNLDASLTASYEVDLWGRLSRAEESARATLLAGEANRRVVVQTLVADVVRTWLQVKELQCQLGLAERTVNSYRSTLQTVEDRYAGGVSSALDVRLARQNLLSAEASVPESRRLLRVAVRRLEILAGRYPGATVMPADAAAVMVATMPEPLPAVPVGLPSSLLERRPDLVQAEANLHASVANIGQAKARLYPTLSLTGSAGYNSGELDSWFDSDHDVWSLVGNLVMPLINRGATKAQIRAAEARAQQSVAGYQLAVLNAFSEVESALDAEVLQARREGALTRTVNESRLSLELAERRYTSGLDPLLTTLETQRRLFTTESQLLSTQQARRTARVNLILALGGHWDTALTVEGDTP